MASPVFLALVEAMPLGSPKSSDYPRNHRSHDPPSERDGSGATRPSEFDSEKGFPRSLVIPLILLSTFGILTVLLGTKTGIGLSRDSVAYIGAARNLAAGDGLTLPFGTPSAQPVTLEGPLYPVALSLSRVFNVDPLTWARWLGALLFGAIIFSSGAVIFRWTDHSRWAALTGALVLLSSVPLLDVYSWAWTETLFIPLELGSLSFLAHYLRGQQVKHLIISALFTGLAIVTRYAGASLLATSLLLLLLGRPRSIARRPRLLAAYLFVSFTPAAIWLGRNVLVSESATGREFALHPVDMEKVRTAARTVSAWFFPLHWLPDVIGAGLALLIVVAGLSLGLGLSWFRGTERARRLLSVPDLATVMAVAVLVHVGFLLLAMYFLAAGVALGNRQLSPAYFGLLFVVLVSCYRLVAGPVRSPGLLRGGALAVALLLVGTSLVRAATWVASRDARSQSYVSSGFASSEWRSSDLLHRLRSIKTGRPIFSNEPAGAYISTGLLVIGLPRKYNVSSLKRNGRYSAELASMKRQLQARNGVVAYFGWVIIDYFPSVQDLTGRLGLVVEVSARDGLLLRAPP